MMRAVEGSASRLEDLLAGIAPVNTMGNRVITGLSIDSRQIRPGDCFLACQGSSQHGRKYIDEAVKAGAVAVLVEMESPYACVPAGAVHHTSLYRRHPPWRSDGYAVPVIAIPDLRSRAGAIADRFYGHPSSELFVVGVTGTNGKTSVSHFIAQALHGTKALGPCGVLGTLGWGMWPHLLSATLTTPDPVTLHRLLADLRDGSARSAVLEVSSHSLEQGRVAGVRFDVAVFTNLTRDHLDYHGSMEAYGQAKRLLFQKPGLQAAVVNLDDPFSQEILALLPSSVRALGYTLDQAHELPVGCESFRARGVSVTRQGLTMEIVTPCGVGRLNSSLLGRFNAYNLLAATAVLIAIGMPLDEALARLAKVTCVRGRMECFGGDRGAPLVVIDYAHTPDALEQALRALREVCPGELWCVFGCGGERDPGKRPLMGQIAEALADHVVLTNDNPRGEEPLAIIYEIFLGMRRRAHVYVESDRTKAIETAVLQAEEDDVVLVAGKGHESYQEIGGQRLPLSDRDVVRRLLGGYSL